MTGAVAGWQTAADLPNQQTAAAIAETAMPGTEAVASLDDLFGWEGFDAESRPDPAFGGLFAGGDEYSAGFRGFSVDRETSGPAPLREAKTKLAAGWHVGPVSEDADGGEFTATRDGLTLAAETQGDGQFSEIVIERAQPIAVPVLAVAGLVIGALLGWTVAVWADQRMAGWGRIRESVVAAPLTTAGAPLALPTLYNLWLTAVAVAEPARAIPVWRGYVWEPLGLLTVLALVALGVAVAKTAVAMPRRPRSVREPVVG